MFYLQLVGTVSSTRRSAALVYRVHGKTMYLINTRLQPGARAQTTATGRLNGFIRICRYTALKRGVNDKVK